jgi:predicted RNA-binding Zn ribbon-like protein
MVVTDMTAMTHSHAHSADLEAFLDLVNSVELEDGRPVEHLPDAAVAAEFLAVRDLAHRESLEDAARDERAAERRLARLRAVRSAAREVWDAVVEHRDANPTAIDRLNDALRHRPIVELTPGGEGCGVGHRHVGDPWDEALARMLEPFVTAVARGDVERFRICANDGCRWVFYDESRAGRRRWCDMSSCGNRAKAARHRARKKAAEPAEAPAG